jgi:hypothetical protein
LRQGICKTTNNPHIKTKESYHMKTLKKWVATLALAMMIFPILPVQRAQAEPDAFVYVPGVIESYINCVSYCVNTYAPWSLRSMACSFDCYISFYGNVIGALIGPAVSAT